MMRRIPAVLLLAIATTSCASSGAVPRPFPSPRGTARGEPPAAASASRPGGYAVAGTALDLRGAPYRDGGADPKGFDCSGFVQYVFGLHAVAMPRSVAEQARVGRAIEAGALQPGDLVFFSTVSPGPSHVGIAIGGDEFVHAPSGRGEVRVERLSAPYWAQRFVGARRVL
jgi:cell wall-associated NlpC family hydrolase